MSEKWFMLHVAHQKQKLFRSSPTYRVGCVVNSVIQVESHWQLATRTRVSTMHLKRFHIVFFRYFITSPHIGHMWLKGIDNNLLVNDLEHLQQDHLSARSFMQRSSSPEGEKEIERDTIVFIRYLDTYLLALRRSNAQTALYSDCAASIFNDTLHTHWHTHTLSHSGLIYELLCVRATFIVIRKCSLHSRCELVNISRSRFQFRLLSSISAHWNWNGWQGGGLDGWRNGDSFHNGNVLHMRQPRLG